MSLRSVHCHLFGMLNHQDTDNHPDWICFKYQQSPLTQRASPGKGKGSLCSPSPLGPVSPSQSDGHQPETPPDVVDAHTDFQIRVSTTTIDKGHLQASSQSEPGLPVGTDKAFDISCYFHLWRFTCPPVHVVTAAGKTSSILINHLNLSVLVFSQC